MIAKMNYILAFLVIGMSVQASPVYKGSAVLVVKPERIRAFKIALSKIIEPTRKEQGNISYEAFQVLDENGKETNRFEFHELWKSKDAMMIDHKENSKHMRVFFKTLKIGTPDSYLESFQVDGKMVITLGDSNGYSVIDTSQIPVF